MCRLPGWFLAGLPLLRLTQISELLHHPRYWLWLTCFFVFGATFGTTPWNVDEPRLRWRQLASLAVQSITALVMIVLVCSGHEGALLVLIAAQLGWFMPLRHALLWVAAQALLMGTILSVGWPLRTILSLMSTYVGFQVLALFSAFSPRAKRAHERG